MKPEQIALLTGWGRGLGSGHIQRMASLVFHLNQSGWCRAHLVCEPYSSLPPELTTEFKSQIGTGTELIVRDKRDSTTEEMRLLQQIAPVLTIDDAGAGRFLADHVVDLLPNLLHQDPDQKEFYKPDMFLFGAGFLQSLKSSSRNHLSRDYDYALYPGLDASPDHLDFLRSLIPKDCTSLILQGTSSYLSVNNVREPFPPLTYAEALLSSKVMMSHFGITLYEAQAAGCHLVALNPTDYHSRLCGLAQSSLPMHNLGTKENLDIDEARTILREVLQERSMNTSTPRRILELAQKRLQTIAEYIRGLMKTDTNETSISADTH